MIGCRPSRVKIPMFVSVSQLSVIPEVQLPYFTLPYSVCEEPKEWRIEDMISAEFLRN